MRGGIINIASLCIWAANSHSLILDVTSDESVCEAASAIVEGEMNYYLGTKYGGPVGIFVNPYYWWHAGEVFGGWVDYWAFCARQNETFTGILSDAMYAQRGEKNDYMPLNQSLTEGNDDQGVWGMAIMQAVERNFTNNPDRSWLNMIQALFNSMNSRWDRTSCGGGLRWQIFQWNNGYSYKNSIANGCLFHLAARLYRYTGEEYYLQVAEKVYDWMWLVGYFEQSKNGFVIHDGADDTNNCTSLVSHRWSYTYGIFMAGSAYLYNSTGDPKWQDFTTQLVEVSAFFFNGSIMSETTCATTDRCNNDQRSFRSLFSRCLGLTAMLVPETYAHIVTGWLTPSAQAAAQSCSGGSDHVTCGENWSQNGWDRKFGLGEQMSALECILSMITTRHVPLTPETGGSIEGGDISAGNDTDYLLNSQVHSVTTGDKVGAAILTVFVLGGIICGLVWMLL